MILKKQDVVCAHEFSWLAKKVVCVTFDVLGISALIVCAIFGKIKIFSKSEMANFPTHFHKKYTKRTILFIKLKKQNAVCAHEFPWYAKKVICTTYDILGILALL